MGRLVYPDIYIDCIYDLTASFFKCRNLYNIIIDIDNTLSAWGSKAPGEKECNWIMGIRESGINICILSNSFNRRVRNYCSGMNISYAENSFKPLKSSFKRAMKILGSDSESTCVIGDQAFTDILGGNACGLYTILVKPIGKREFITTKFFRAIWVFFYKKHLAK